MEPTLDDNVKPDGFVFGSNDKEDKKAVELLKVELVLNVPPMEDGGKLHEWNDTSKKLNQMRTDSILYE